MPTMRSFSCPSSEWTSCLAYSSGEATSPTLDRLGGIGWQKTKAKAKRAMRDMADELLRLYAERKLVRGYAFSARRAVAA